MRLRTFRPFPVDALQTALKNIKTIAVMDKSMSFGGFGGPVFNEVRNALYDSKEHPTIVNYIFGLGGRDSSPRDLRRIYEDLIRVNKTGRVESIVHYLGLRE